MAEIRELVLTFLERLSHNALPKNRKRETLDACIGTRAPWEEIRCPSRFAGFNRTILQLLAR